MPSSPFIEREVEQAYGSFYEHYEHKDRLLADYVILVIIHDNHLIGKTTPRINNQILPDNDGEEYSLSSVWENIEANVHHEYVRTHIQCVQQRVATDLERYQKREETVRKKITGASGKAGCTPQATPETEQKTPPAKRCWIWACVKKIPRWIYVLVIFLAAFLTCIYFLWWLWTTFWKK